MRWLVPLMILWLLAASIAHAAPPRTATPYHGAGFDSAGFNSGGFNAPVPKPTGSKGFNDPARKPPGSQDFNGDRFAPRGEGGSACGRMLVPVASLALVSRGFGPE